MKRGKRKQRFKKGGKLGQGVGALKKQGWLVLALELCKQLTHKLPLIYVIKNPFMAESYCNFLWLLVKYESLQDSVSLALLKTVTKTPVEMSIVPSSRLMSTKNDNPSQLVLRLFHNISGSCLQEIISSMENRPTYKL